MTYIQIGSVVGFVAALFILYRVLIKIKDAEIKRLETKIKELENLTLDILLERTQIRLKAAYEEIERLSEEKQIEEGVKNATLEELGNITEQLKELQQRTQTIQNIDPMIAEAFSMPSTAKLADVVEKHDEKGTWSPSVQYMPGNASIEYAQAISVDEAKYTFHRGNVKVVFDFSVDLKKVPSGSTLAIGGVPFTVDSRNVYEFKVRQTGLNHSEDLTVSARRGFTWFDLSYVTDGSEGSVRFWGYIVYDCTEQVLWDSPDP